MKTILLVLAAVLLLSCLACAGPLVAGTAPGQIRFSVRQYTVGLHYPLGAKTPQYYQLDGSHPNPDNGSFPYDEWRDEAKVPGHHPAMTKEYVIMGSHRRK